jgi:hypothetical protein
MRLTTRHRCGELLALALGLLLLPAAAQAPPAGVRGKRGVATKRAVVNFTELARREAAAPKRPVTHRVIPFMPVPTAFPVPAGIKPQAPAAAPEEGAPEAATPEPGPAPAPQSPSPAASFEALGDDDTAIPPDTMGAVGPNHLVVTLNNGVRIQNRSGTEISVVSLDTFWGTTGTFDPRVMYDPYNNRWIVAAVKDGELATSAILVGVSQSSDPTGNWNLYTVDADDTDTNWADFPMLGFNKNWIVVTVNIFPNAGGSFVEGHIYAFDKADLYAAGTGNFTMFTDANAAALAPAVTYDNSLATEYLLQDYNGNFAGNGYIRLSTITGSVGSEVFTAQATVSLISVASPWDSQGPMSGADFAPQLDTTDKIQTNDSRMQNVVYRNGSVWATQTAFLPANNPTHSAAQWWELLPDGTVQQFGRVEDTNAVIFYAFPSIAVNSQDDVLLGYSSFSATQYASGNYSFRAHTDTASTMQADVLLKAGEATYYKTFSGTDNRWGDYSHTVVDPVNDTDFWTIQEYASSPPFGNGDDRWGTWWGKVVPPGSAVKKRRGQLISQ